MYTGLFVIMLLAQWKVLGVRLMGRGFEFPQGHWWCLEGHPTTIPSVLPRPVQKTGFLRGYGGSKQT